MDKPEKPWGLILTMRTADIYFDTEDDIQDEYVSIIVSMMFYQGFTFFIRGTGGGMRLIDKHNGSLM